MSLVARNSLAQATGLSPSHSDTPPQSFPPPVLSVPLCSVKMLALATQKFIADIAQDALQHCKQRQATAGATAASKKAAKVCGGGGWMQLVLVVALRLVLLRLTVSSTGPSSHSSRLTH